MKLIIRKYRENGWITFQISGSAIKKAKIRNRINKLWSHDDEVQRFVETVRKMYPNVVVIWNDETKGKKNA